MENSLRTYLYGREYLIQCIARNKILQHRGSQEPTQPPTDDGEGPLDVILNDASSPDLRL